MFRVNTKNNIFSRNAATKKNKVAFIIYTTFTKLESNVRRKARGRTTQANEDIAKIKPC